MATNMQSFIQMHQAGSDGESLGVDLTRQVSRERIASATPRWPLPTPLLPFYQGYDAQRGSPSEFAQTVNAYSFGVDESDNFSLSSYGYHSQQSSIASSMSMGGRWLLPPPPPGGRGGG